MLLWVLIISTSVYKTQLDTRLRPCLRGAPTDLEALRLATTKASPPITFTSSNIV